MIINQVGSWQVVITNLKCQNLLELIITKREFIRKQKENSEIKKNSTVAQLDDKVDDKIDSTAPGTVRSILVADLTANAFKKNMKRKPENISSVSGSNKETNKDYKEKGFHKSNQSTYSIFHFYGFSSRATNSTNICRCKWPTVCDAYKPGPKSFVTIRARKCFYNVLNWSV